MLEEFAGRVYDAMLGRAVRGMRGVKPMDAQWVYRAEKSRRALLERYPAAAGAELREFCSAAGVLAGSAARRCFCRDIPWPVFRRNCCRR